MCLEPLFPSFPFVPGPRVLAVVVVKDVRVVFEIVQVHLNIKSYDSEFEMNLEQLQTNIHNSSLTTHLFLQTGTTPMRAWDVDTSWDLGMFFFSYCSYFTDYLLQLQIHLVNTNHGHQQPPPPSPFFIDHHNHQWVTMTRWCVVLAPPVLHQPPWPPTSRDDSLVQ